MELQPKSEGGGLYLSRRRLSKSVIGRVDEEGHDGRRGHELVQQFQPLWRKFAAQGGRARDVAARSVQANDKSKRNRVAPCKDNDWNRRGCRLCRECRRCSTRCGNHADLATS